MSSEQGCEAVPGAKNVHALDWPSNSPDLHPIENLWNLMKAKVVEKYPSDFNKL